MKFLSTISLAQVSESGRQSQTDDNPWGHCKINAKSSLRLYPGLFINTAAPSLVRVQFEKMGPDNPAPSYAW